MEDTKYKALFISKFDTHMNSEALRPHEQGLNGFASHGVLEKVPEYITHSQPLENENLVSPRKSD